MSITIAYQSFLAGASIMAILAMLDYFYSIFLYLSDNVLIFIMIFSFIVFIVFIILITKRQMFIFKKHIEEFN